MKFKKLDTRCFDAFHHYTRAEYVPNIMNEGLRVHQGAKSSGFMNDDDSIYNDQYNFKNIYNKSVSKDQTGLCKNYDYINGNFKPQNKYLTQASVIDGLNDLNNNGRSILENSAPVRLVNKFTPIENNKDYVTFNNPDGTDGSVEKLSGTDYKESQMWMEGNTSGKNFMVQLPFGAVTKNNAGKYEDNLKIVDPSKFDVSDPYTRRIYNLWAKKNNKPLLPGSEKYR